VAKETKQAKSLLHQIEPALAGFVPTDPDFESGANPAASKIQPASAGFVPLDPYLESGATVSPHPPEFADGRIIECA